jgi:hypothetical protein
MEVDYMAFNAARPLTLNFNRYCLLSFLIAFTTLFWLICGAAIAATPIRVVTDSWAGYAERDGQGYYLQVLQLIFPEPEWQLSVRFMPYQRSITTVRQAEADIVLGAAPDDLKNLLISRVQLELDVVDAALTSNALARWKQTGSLSGMRIGARLGYELNQLFDESFRYQEYRTLPQMFELMMRSRLDGILDYKDDLIEAANSLSPAPDYHLVESVASSEVRLGFINTDFGHTLRQQADNRLEEMVKTGQLRALMIQAVGNDEDYPF